MAGEDVPPYPEGNDIEAELQGILRDNEEYGRDMAELRQKEELVVGMIASYGADVSLYETLLNERPIGENISDYMLDVSQRIKEKEVAAGSDAADLAGDPAFDKLVSEFTQCYWTSVLAANVDSLEQQSAVHDWPSKQELQAAIFIDPALDDTWRNALLLTSDRIFKGPSLLYQTEADRSWLIAEAQFNALSAQISYQRLQAARTALNEALAGFANHDSFSNLTMQLASMLVSRFEQQPEYEAQWSRLIAKNLHYVGLSADAPELSRAIDLALEAIRDIP